MFIQDNVVPIKAIKCYLRQQNQNLKQIKSELTQLQNCSIGDLGTKKNDLNFPYFVVTRLGIGIYNREWLAYRLLLFEAITFPSVTSQSDKNFIWLIVIDRRMPEPYKTKLVNIASSKENIDILEVDFFVQYGEIVEDYIKNYVKDKNQMVAISRIDDDDAWHFKTIEQYRQYINQQYNFSQTYQKENSNQNENSFQGTILTFPYGYDWLINDNLILKFYSPCHSMALCYWIPAEYSFSAITTSHTKAKELDKILGIKLTYKELETSTPMWLYVRHQTNITAARSRKEKTKNFGIQASDDILKRYGVDLHKYACYRREQHNFMIQVPETQWAHKHNRKSQLSEINREAGKLLKLQKSLSDKDPKQFQIHLQLETLRTRLDTISKHYSQSCNNKNNI
jgi:hypothetical protein